ncbi:MAG TPA: GspH/FimT family pseudopilin [Burkholderiales bacterium]|nr:GspH/FimT family pseudopilin [Burkholderiales bacterium]
MLGYEEGRLVLRRAPRGFSLIELMIGLAIITILLVLGLPAFNIFLQNTQIRNAAETTLAGITLARVEAVRRNTTVRFQLVSNLTSGCALSASSLDWVVSQANPSGACDAAASDTTAPQIIQKKSAREGSSNVTIATTGGSTIVFDALGRVVGAGITVLDFANTNGTCEHVDAVNGTMRCLRILVSVGGQVKMCDPKVPLNSPPVDPRECN